MRSALSRSLTGALVLTLLAVPAAAAGQAPSGYRLNLRSDPAVQALVGLSGDPAPAPLTVDHPSVREIWYATAQDTAGGPDMGGKRGVGRWLKKHWWVPALVGVALGVVLLDDHDTDTMGDD